MNLVPILDLQFFDPLVIHGWEPGQRSVVIPVAACAQTTCRVAYRCHLFQADDVEEGCWEFIFEMHVEWMDDSELPFITMDRDMATPYLPESVRAAIMPAVELCIGVLVQDVNPVSIYRVAKNGGMPEKALKKHHIVGEAFVRFGYTRVDTGMDRAGRPYWRMYK